MELIENIDKIETPYKNAVITIGNFDGVHIGHQALFHEVIEKADALGGTSIVMTFEPHPSRVLKQNNHPPLITLYEQKLELIESSGIDVLICIPFTKEFAMISAKTFVEDILHTRIGMKLGFEVILTQWIQMANGQPGRISSTKTRELVRAGKVEDAQKMLGRHYQIRGTVITGLSRGGKLLGFPTANINLIDELCPKTGIYAVTVTYEGKLFKGVANIGYSPTFDDKGFAVEVHILDFNDDIYGQKIYINFVKRIRDEIKFTDIADLIDQINKDIVEACEILS
jgi:riboflavin kinase/FMN adenylyltransferase